MEGSKLLPAPSAAYLNQALEPTAYSVRSFLASASGGGSPLAFGIQTLSRDSQREPDFFDVC